jgi:hypothetical protein
MIALPAYAVGAQLGRDGDERGRGAGLVAAVLATTSAGSMYMTLEFVKNGIGLTVAMTALWLVLRALETPRRARVIAALVGIAAAVLTHKMAAGIVIGIAIPAALVETHQRGKLRWRRALPIAVGLGVIGVLVLIGVAMPRRFLSPADLALLDSTFTTEADWSLPVLGNKLRLGYEPVIGVVLALVAAWALLDDRGSMRGRLLVVGRILQCVGVVMFLGAVAIRSGAVAAGVVVGGVALAVGGSLLRRRAARMLGASTRGGPSGALPHSHAGAGRDVAAWCVIALAVLIGLPWLDATSAQGLAMRLRVIAFVPMALCAAIALRILARYLQRMIDGKPPRAAFGIVIAIAIVAMRASGGPRTEGQVLTHPALISSVQAAVGKIPDGGVAVVQERHIAFMFAWYARVPISMRPEPVAPERRYRVMPLAFIQMGSSLDLELLAARERPELPRVIGLHPLHPNGMVIVPEPTWQAILAQLPAVDRIRLEAWPTI